MSALSPFVALLLSTALLVSGYSLQNALIPLRGEAEAFGAFWVGGLGSGFFLGFALGCWLPQRWLRAPGTFACLLPLSG